MGKRLAVLAVGSVLLGATGCGIVAQSVGAPLEYKAVAYKAGTRELVATDGTYCFVSRGKFERVEVRDHVRCSWSSAPRRDTPGT